MYAGALWPRQVTWSVLVVSTSQINSWLQKALPFVCIPCAWETFYYSPLLKRIELTFTAWLESLNSPYEGRRKHRDHAKVSVTAWPFHWLAFVKCFFYNSLKSNLYTILTTQNTTGNNCSILHGQNTAALQPNVLLGWNTSITGQKQGRDAFPQPSPRTPNITKVSCKLLSQYHYYVTAAWIPVPVTVPNTVIWKR